MRALVLAVIALAACATSALADRPLFADSAPIAFALTGPFPTLVYTVPVSIKPFPATLTLTQGAGAPATFSLEMRARGHSRRTAGFCTFPPLSLKFDKEQVKGTFFAHQKRLKLVTYCRPEPDYEQRIVLEYLAYRLYNVVTPLSFQARAAEVTYRSSDADKGVTRFGFLLEAIDDVAGRNDRVHLAVTSHQINRAQLDARAAARAALFEYMIANLDWDFLAAQPGLACCHNTDLLAADPVSPATKDVVPVPYDYDWSGLVDSPYAGPPEGIPIEKMTERYYHGYCVSNSVMGDVIQEYIGHRAEMMALVDGEPHLNARFREKADRFLDGFFAAIADPRRVQRDIIALCR